MITLKTCYLLITISSLGFADVLKYYLYTRDTVDHPEELFLNDENSVRRSKFDSNLQTKIVIHGWFNNYKDEPNPNVRNAYFPKGKYNIIAVDWGRYAKNAYPVSYPHVPALSQILADFLEFLHKKFRLDYNKTVLIGHSVGAHIAGLCGKLIKSDKLAAIVGLDPANLFFENQPPTKRLAATDARYVLTVHTGTDTYGFLNPIGKASFYPNWGSKQPGCGVEAMGFCSHSRSVKFYERAVKGNLLVPIYRCESFNEIKKRKGCKTRTNITLGGPLETEQTQGIFYFK
ncbi:phospholipase A1-like, partial [Teleopsis dalmanni]|uniref:phospholipase A1-like n=1 Tax=Teleopsis dalmanni TaxID=139649 RepID=UPI0018CED406